MSTLNPNLTYNYKVVRQFAIMTVVWGIVGMALGV
ncbi:MAG: cytochrome c oxidase cbb3-type subunit 1, partial [Marinobacter psychrophilus]